MQVFIYAELLNEPNYSYQKPILSWIKQTVHSVDCLDIDSFTEDYLITQACQMLENATTKVVYFKSAVIDASMGSLARLAEVLIQNTEGKRLMILEGQHTRLEKIFLNRPGLEFLHNPDKELMKAQLHLLLK